MQLMFGDRLQTGSTPLRAVPHGECTRSDLPIPDVPEVTNLTVVWRHQGSTWKWRKYEALGQCACMRNLRTHAARTFLHDARPC
jgi:hypothetical protein